ncbi:hypothetical protein MmazTMA_11450 [Methanosarcina mazei]|nr:hypothetical protein MmazTMA_11450 [Methanosarcina mazei]
MREGEIGKRQVSIQIKPEALFAPEDIREIFRICSGDKVRLWTKTEIRIRKEEFGIQRAL